ncbi:MAG: hypothetical protein CMK88_00910 [Pseudomonadales bacterium]|nr:hypothetical protein [Pseudomonadales bacterium]
MAKNPKETSSDVSSLASEVLRDPHASQIAKSLAASALSQSSSSKETGKAMEERASKALSSERSSEVVKTLAGSIVSQSRKSR